MATTPTPTSKTPTTPTTPKASESKAGSTYKTTPLEPVQPLGEMPDINLTKEQVKELAGDLGPGEVGWIKLDEDGNPTGPAVKILPPAEEGPVARVVGTPQPRRDEIVTPAGAPVTKQMNPEPKLWDEGMLARNPPPKDSMKVMEKYKIQQGAGVVNQPVTS